MDLGPTGVVALDDDGGGPPPVVGAGRRPA